MLADVDVTTAANAVVDRFLDGGLDAVYADVSSGRLFLVQTKWHAKGGHKTIELGDALKFLSGAQDLLNERYANFNARIKGMSGVLSAVLRQPLHITLVVATTGHDELGAATQSALDNFCAEMTASGVHIDQRVLGLSAVHAFVRDGLGAPSVDLTVVNGELGHGARSAPGLLRHGQCRPGGGLVPQVWRSAL
jgi:hypothetical protein